MRFSLSPELKALHHLIFNVHQQSWGCPFCGVFEELWPVQTTY